MIGPLMKELGGTTSAVAVVRDGEVIGEITADSILQRLSQ
jgi:predicted transcriptional regulator